jgi:hypothetical protein
MMCNCDVQLTDGQVRSAPKTARRANHFKISLLIVQSLRKKYFA